MLKLRLCTLPLVFLILLPGLLAQGGPPGATVTDLETVADDPDIMYAASGQGVYRSLTAGETWEPMNDGLPSLDIARVAGNRGVVYASVGENGVYRSREGGAWESASPGIEGKVILSIEVDPQDSRIVYAGTISGEIFKSLNSADGWTSVSLGLEEGSYLDIAVSPNDPQLVFATNLSGVSPTGRLFRSTNGGTNWSRVISGPTVLLGIGYSRSTPGTVWFASANGLFRTLDSGATFTGPLLGTVQFWDVAVDPADSQVVYAATRGRGVFKSVDGGATWNTTGPELPRGDVVNVEATATTIYAAMNGTGVYRSYDGGDSWRASAAGMAATDILALSINPADGERIVATTTGGGAFRSDTGGMVWQESREGLAAFQVTSMTRSPQAPETVYAGTLNPYVSTDGSFQRSKDGGASWETMLLGLPVFAVAADPADANQVYFGTTTDPFTGSSGLVTTTNGGESFELIFGTSNELAFTDVIEVEVDPTNSRNLYVIARNPTFRPAAYEVLRSSDAGASWFGTGFTTTPLLELTIDPADPRRIFLGGFGGMALSTDSGATFAFLSGGLPDDGVTTVGSIVVDANDGGAVYATTSVGVYKSTDGGTTWALANTGLGDAQVRTLQLDPKNGGVIYAGTRTAGVYKTTDGGANWGPTGGVPGLAAAGITNAVTFESGPVAPGGIVSIFVNNPGPPEGVSAAFDPETGKLPTTLAGVRVFFNDVPAALFWVRFDQLNVQVPFEVAGLDFVDVRVEYEGSPSTTVRVAVTPTALVVFPGVLNQDSILNTESNPAGQGTVIQFFATGQGVVSPALMTGQPAPAAEPLARPVASVRVLVNGQEAQVAFAGLTPNLVGLLQINIYLPAGLSGRLEIQVFINGVESPTRAIVYVT